MERLPSTPDALMLLMAKYQVPVARLLMVWLVRSPFTTTLLFSALLEAP